MALQRKVHEAPTKYDFCNHSLYVFIGEHICMALPSSVFLSGEKSPDLDHPFKFPEEW
jgi:hypothetical protein